jgi:hypothetical protein
VNQCHKNQIWRLIPCSKWGKERKYILIKHKQGYIKVQRQISNRSQVIRKEQRITFTALYLWARAVHRLYRRQQPSKTLRARAISQSVGGLLIFIGSVPNIWSNVTTGSSFGWCNEFWKRTGITVTEDKLISKRFFLRSQESGVRIKYLTGNMDERLNAFLSVEIRNPIYAIQAIKGQGEKISLYTLSAELFVLLS